MAASLSRRPWVRWPDGRARIAYGGDYNPEQWDRATWVEDVALMQAAGVNLVNVAIFGWSHLEPEAGRYEFGLYDDVLDLLHASGIAVDLANGTASPPAWLALAHPEILPETAGGTTLGFGSRQSWCPNSPIFRDHALRLTEAVARHFGSHPALALWHVSNEFGCHNARCYCDRCAAAFRTWLAARYGDLDGVNHAWGTAFWSQRYTEWAQITPPRRMPAFANPTQVLDFNRFSSDALLGQYRAEAEVLRRITPDVAVTTNLLVMGGSQALDYSRWAPHLDVVANDHYLLEGDPEQEIELALSADVVRGLARGAPWMLMESAAGAVNWGSVNAPKAPGQLRRNSLAQVARGADAVGFFQWRASRSGAEKHHSAMLPHAGAQTRVHREVRALGADLARLAPLAGTRVEAEVALLYDWESWWAADAEAQPSRAFSYRAAVMDLYRPLWRAQVSVDVVPVGMLDEVDLNGYRLILAPALHLVRESTAARISTAVAGGADLIASYNSGVVDAQDRVWPGGAPGPLSELLGLRVDEVCPLRPGQQVALEDGSVMTDWVEDLSVTDAEIVAGQAEGHYTGRPAITRRRHGAGCAWYLGGRLTESDRTALLTAIWEGAGVLPAAGASPEVEVVRRSSPDGDAYVVAINHGAGPGTVELSGTDLLTGAAWTPQSALPPHGVAVLALAP